MLNKAKSNKTYRKAKSIALILSALMLISPLTACTTENSRDAIVSVENGSGSSHKTPSNSEVSTVKSLDEINPKLSVEKWGDNKYYVIDEDSLFQIIDLAMDNVQKFYTEIGAPNMTYDKNLNIVEGKDNFYPEWQNEAFYMARAMSESSRRIDLVTTIPGNSTDNYATGIMQICPSSTKETLEQYYKNIFNENVDLSQLQVVPSKTDLANANTSEKAMDNVVEAIYNNIFLSMCFDVYNIKNINPKSHQNYYAKYGGYREDVRKLATIGLYGTSRSTVINGLIEGKLRERLAEIKHMDTYIKNMEKYQAQYEQKYAAAINEFDEGLQK